MTGDIEFLKGVSRLVRSGMRLLLWRVDSSRRVAALYRGDALVAYGEAICLEWAVARMLDHFRGGISERVYFGEYDRPGKDERQIDYREQRRRTRIMQEGVALVELARGKLARARTEAFRAKWHKAVKAARGQAQGVRATSWADDWIGLDRRITVTYEDGLFCIRLFREEQVVTCSHSQRLSASSSGPVVLGCQAGNTQITSAFREVHSLAQARNLILAQVSAFAMKGDVIGEKL